MTDLAARRGLLAAALAADGLDALLLAGTGLHLIDVPDPVAHLTGFRSLGTAVAALTRDGSCTLLLTPPEDVERAQGRIGDAQCVGTDDLGASLERLHLRSRRVVWAGLGALPVRLARTLALAVGSAAGWDLRFDQVTAAKTGQEIADAQRATVIAEAGFRELLILAKDGVKSGLRECDLAVELNLRMRALGADASFLMLNAAPRSPAIMPSSERPLQPGDMILVELSPSVNGQFVQICRTAILGEPAPALEANYRLLTVALADGLAAVRPGVPVSAICDAIDGRMAEAGYAAYSRPPHLRRRGHGLGCGSIWPGDIAYDNPVLLEPDMLFVVHPNQLLPEAGYMMCGEPVRVTDSGGEVLSRELSRLAVIAL